jgi:hypothetical protein
MSEEGVRPVLAADEEAFGGVGSAPWAAKQNPCAAIATTHESRRRDLRKCISLTINLSCTMNLSCLLACAGQEPEPCERAFGGVRAVERAGFFGGV